jgi:ribosomal 50S subunit-recycling heat shock protein
LSPSATETGCRADVWLWRARFFKTRGLAAEMVVAGRIRVSRNGADTRLDKASRLIRVGDEVVFALGGRLTAVKVVALGDRRGPAAEARSLYISLAASGPQGRPKPRSSVGRDDALG